MVSKRSLIPIREKTHLLTRKVDTDSSLTQQASVKLVLLPRHASNNNITQRRYILDRQSLHINNIMRTLLQSLPRKLLHPRNIHTINTSPIIRQQRRQRPSHYFRAIHHANRMTKQPVPVGKNRVVDVEVLENLNYGQRRAGQDALLALGLGVQKAHILVHVEDVAVAEAFDVFVHIDDLLQVLVLAVVEDGVVDDDAVDFAVGIGGEDGFFDVVARDFAEGVAEAAVGWGRSSMLVGCDEQLQYMRSDIAFFKTKTIGPNTGM